MPEHSRQKRSLDGGHLLDLATDVAGQGPERTFRFPPHQFIGAATLQSMAAWRPPQLITLDDINDRGALSRTHQPAFRTLVQDVATAERVTLVIGAGFSRDAGLPSWPSLIEGLIDELDSTHGIDLSAMTREDPDDPMRKAEHVIEMRRSAKRLGTTEELVRKALYSGSAQHVPGPLLRATAELVKALGAKVTVLTTNYDELLEKALADAGIATGVYLLNSHEQWPQLQETQRQLGRVPIFHLHGRVRRMDSEKRDFVVLSESHFLRHGPSVRKIVVEALNNSVTIFFGLSMTDPNLVGPLWDTRDTRNPSYVVTVPERIAPFTIQDSRLYALAKSEYLHSKLRVAPLYLKTYGQIEQLLTELALSAVDIETYELPESDPRAGAYGARLHRLLKHAYAKVGAAGDAPFCPPVGDESEELRKRLTSFVATDSQLGTLLSSLSRDRGVKRRLHELEVELRSAERQPENYGLQLWLRTGEAEDAGAEYTVQLVGSSDLTLHGELARRSQRWPIENDSENMAARAIARSRVEIWKALPEISMAGMWQGMVASPIRLTQLVSTRRGDQRVRMTIGSLCLLTTHAIKVEREALAPNQKLSMLSVLTPEQRVELSAALHTASIKLLK